ncbi:MAG TPA: arylamine N-acetyltransferase [Longimicrobiales bacterium]|nr:arylamine N-acetyltransferase [Longimicrobiales bacterium]
MIDLDAYLARIGYAGPIGPTRETLEALHLAHVCRVPFENIDVRLRRPIGLDLESLQAKLVRGNRGGYCFEQNTLFAAALRAVGFEVATLEARVRPPGATTVLPRTHMTLEVRVDGREHLADVGFGADGPLLPVPLNGTPSEQPDARYRLAREGSAVRVLQRLWRGAWRDLYAFSRVPALPVDFEVANHFTSTHPDSAFVGTLTVQRSGPAGRHILRGRTYAVRDGDVETTRVIGPEELTSLLRDIFGVDLSDEDARIALGDA